VSWARWQRSEASRCPDTCRDLDHYNDEYAVSVIRLEYTTGKCVINSITLEVIFFAPMMSKVVIRVKYE